MNAESAKEKQPLHKISVQGRSSLEAEGVTDVLGFDEQTVVLGTVCGTMTVTGSGLRVRVLNVEQGIVAMDGKVDSVEYEDSSSEPTGNGGFFRRLFR